MSIKDQIKHDLKIITNIVLSINLLYGDFKFFDSKASNYNKIFDDYIFLVRIYHSLFIHLILEITVVR